METVYIALGSNLADPLNQIESALVALKQLPNTQFIQCSRFYRTKPLGPQDQPDYLNTVVELKTNLQPEQLLNATQAIELEHGRVRKAERWGPRTLDLDILLFGQQTINTPRLTIPHYDMKNREFMLYPLAEIAPNLIFPDGEYLSSIIKQLDKNGLTYW